jgi:hypothetical protein
MGQTIETQCRDCGLRFDVDEGGGFFFHKLRCDRCARTTDIRFEEVAHLDSPEEKGRKRRIEQYAGLCACGGQYLFDAPARCPVCGSRNLKEGHILVYYD